MRQITISVTDAGQLTVHVNGVPLTKAELLFYLELARDAVKAERVASPIMIAQQVPNGLLRIA